MTWSYRKVFVTLTLGHKLKIYVFISFSYFWSTIMKNKHFKLHSYNLYINIILLISPLYAQNITDVFILHYSLNSWWVVHICSIYQKIVLSTKYYYWLSVSFDFYENDREKIFEPSVKCLLPGCIFIKNA